MKLKGIPNMLVRHNRHKRVKGRRRGSEWFRFDSDGFVNIPDEKLTEKEKTALMAKFEVVNTNLNSMSYKELQQLYSEKTGHSAVGMKKKDMLKELEG